MAIPLIERRENQGCPCVHIVELAGKLDTESQLVKMTIEHCQENSGARVKAVCDDLEESNYRIKECLGSMEKTASLLNEGVSRFKELENRIGAVETWQEDIFIILGEPLPCFIKRWYGYRRYAIGWVTAVTVSLIVSGHAKEALATIKEWAF